MLVLGIDPGTARMGWGIVDYRKRKSKPLRAVSYGCFETAKEWEMPRRLWQLHKELRHLVKEAKPDEVVVERLFFNANAKTAMSVGQARGVVMLVSAQAHLPLYEYTALEAKLALTGYGRAKKDEVQLGVQDILGLEETIRLDDEADALAMALCHLFKNGHLKCHSRKAG